MRADKTRVSARQQKKPSAEKLVNDRLKSVLPGRGVVVAPQCEATQAGADVLHDGGNAADALVTAALVQGVTDPHRCGIGGFGCATVFEAASGEVTCIDFHGRAGRRATESVWADRFESVAPDGFGFVIREKLNDVGHASITVPGMLAGLARIHERYGSLPWRPLVERAAAIARRGFVVTPQLADFWIRPGLFGRVSTHDRLSLTAEGRRVALHADGSTFAAGERLRQENLATTYERIAVAGAADFYHGELARAISDDWERNGALVTAEDLAGYTPEEAAPLSGSYRGLTVYTTPLPGGGVALLQALKHLSKVDVASLGHNTVDFVDCIAPILQATWHDRLAHHGDPRFGGLSAEQLLADEYVDALTGESTPAPGADSPDTTQLTIVDADGNAVSFSHSLGYGSGVFTPGLGFMFNNCMSAFDPRPGRRNSIAPGKARSTAVAETIVLEDGSPAHSSRLTGRGTHYRRARAGAGRRDRL